MTRRPIPAEVLEVAEVVLEALDRAGLGVSVTRSRPDGELERVYANASLGRLLGYGDSPPTRTPIEHLPESERARLIDELLPRIVRGELEQPFQSRIRTAQGEEIPVEMVAGTSGPAGETLNVSFVRDLRKQRRMADALQASESRFRILAERAPDSIVVSARGRVLYANPATAKMLRVKTAKELVGTSLAAVTVADQHAVMFERMQRVMAGEDLGSMEYIGIRSDGERFALEISSMRIEWEGKPAVLGIGRDVTSRKSSQAELMQADRLASVGLLAAGVAHEINNPLTYTLLHLSKLRRMLPDLVEAGAERDRVAQLLNQAIEGGDRVTAIVRDLLAFAREPVGVDEPVDVVAIVDSALRLAHTAVDEHAKVVREVEPVPRVIGNPARLGQVFVNLVSNALQAMEPMPAPRELSLTIRGQGDGVLVEVSDRGTGIDPSIAERIFDPFFTTKDIGQGTGLGLAISRTIVASCGGSLEYRDREGGGATFAVWLPSACPAPEVPSTPRSQSERRRRVLLIEDEIRVLEALRDLLATRCDVVAESRPREALERLRSDAGIDAVLCDLNMPEMNGKDVFAALRIDRPELAERMLFITGGPRNDEQRLFMAEHADRIIGKPVDELELFERIDRVLAEADAARLTEE